MGRTRTDEHLAVLAAAGVAVFALVTAGVVLAWYALRGFGHLILWAAGASTSDLAAVGIALAVIVVVSLAWTFLVEARWNRLDDAARRRAYARR